MIIYGWRNFNRREHRQVRTSCQKCGKRGHLHSYTSTRFATLYFIPVIPIGKQRILSECPSCKESQGISYGKWKKLKKKDLSQAVDHFEANPSNVEAAVAVLELLYIAQDSGVLNRVGPQIKAAFPQNAEVLAQLANVYSYLCMDLEADQAYLDAVDASQGKESSEGISADAEAHMSLSKQEKLKAPNRLLQSLPVLIVPMFLLILLGNFLQSATSSSPKHTYLVNGLSVPYDVLINGESLTLKANRRTWTKLLKYGENEVVATIDGEVRAPISVTIDDSFVKRSSGGSVVLVNPDRAAVLFWEKSGYSYPVANENDYYYTVDSGKSTYVYDEIDYIFRDFPEEVKVYEGSTVFKTSLNLLNNYRANELADLLIDESLFDELSGFLVAKCRAGDDFDLLSSYVRAFIEVDELNSLVKSKLSKRPVEVEWHRVYQDTYDAGSYDELVAEYKGLADSEATNSAILYLYGRVVEDPIEGKILYERSALASSPTGYACNALGYYYMLEGEFSESSKYANRAGKLAPGNLQFKYMSKLAMFGVGNFKGVLDELDVEAQANGDVFYSLKDRLHCLTKLGQEAAARKMGADYLSRLDESDVESISFAKNDIESALALAKQEKETLRKIMAREDYPWWQFWEKVLAGDVKGATELSQEGLELSVSDYLMLYALCKKASQEKLAAENLNAAIELLNSIGGRDELKWASWLSNQSIPAVVDAAHTCLELESHYVYMLALSQRFPTKQEDYLKRAEKIKLKDSFYSLALNL